VKYRKPKKTIPAAVRIESDLYAHAMRKAEEDDSNFSRYVRRLIKADLEKSGLSTPKLMVQ
jgi:hypothetical protein